MTTYVFAGEGLKRTYVPAESVREFDVRFADAGAVVTLQLADGGAVELDGVKAWWLECEVDRAGL